MKISLSPEVERLIEEKVSTGLYRSADEVVRKGLELLQERDAEVQPRSNHAASLAQVFDDIAKEITDREWEKVPTDLSRNLDHYLYGRPKTS